MKIISQTSRVSRQAKYAGATHRRVVSFSMEEYAVRATNKDREVQYRINGYWVSESNMILIADHHGWNAA